MLAAIIGLIGVVVGGLITVLQNAFLDRSRTKQASSVAERQIRFVVDDFNRWLKTALDQQRWWSQPFPLGDWKDQWKSLEPDFPKEEFKKLQDAYDAISILDRAAVRRQELRETASSTAKDDTELKEADAHLALIPEWTTALQGRTKTVQDALDVLDQRADWRARQRRNRKRATAAAVTVLILAAIGLGVDSGVEHTTASTSVTAVTAEMLDASIRQTLGVDFVSCDHVEDSQVDWDCTLANVGLGSGCHTLQLAASRAITPVAVEKGSAACPITAEDRARVKLGSDDCWDLAELERVPGAPKNVPHILPSQPEAGCL